VQSSRRVPIAAVYPWKGMYGCKLLAACSHVDVCDTSRALARPAAIVAMRVCWLGRCASRDCWQRHAVVYLQWGGTAAFSMHACRMAAHSLSLSSAALLRILDQDGVLCVVWGGEVYSSFLLCMLQWVCITL
jgi:hypothetical protein